jgi:hypothetical protein
MIFIHLLFRVFYLLGPLWVDIGGGSQAAETTPALLSVFDSKTKALKYSNQAGATAFTILCALCPATTVCLCSAWISAIVEFDCARKAGDSGPFSADSRRHFVTSLAGSLAGGAGILVLVVAKTQMGMLLRNGSCNGSCNGRRVDLGRFPLAFRRRFSSLLLCTSRLSADSACCSPSLVPSSTLILAVVWL